MNKAAILAWFETLSRDQKIDVLLNMMHGLTIAVRSMCLDYPNDCETRSKSMYVISELNHRLTSAASDMLGASTTFSDQTLIDLMFEPPVQPALSPYFPFVLEKVVERLAK